MRRFAHAKTCDTLPPKNFSVFRGNHWYVRRSELEVRENARLHDREVRLSSGWTVKIGRGFDFYQRPDDWLQVGANDLDLRPCLETTVDIFPTK